MVVEVGAGAEAEAEAEAGRERHGYRYRFEMVPTPHDEDVLLYTRTCIIEVYRAFYRNGIYLASLFTTRSHATS